jgi:hypothetical protein
MFQPNSNREIEFVWKMVHLEKTEILRRSFAPIAFAEQTHVTRYDIFAGYARFESPTVRLSEQGFHFQIGIRPAKWYSLGFDYSNVSGDLTLTPDLLPDALQTQLSQQLALLTAAGRLPAGYA